MTTGDHTLRDVWAHKSDTLTSVVYRHLHRQILTGRIRPGQKINELALSVELETSRGPIREACRQLLSSGLLEAEAQRGFFVRAYSPEEAKELTVVRAHLSDLVGRLAASRITEEQIQALEDIIASLRDDIKSGAVSDFYDKSFQFYMAICDTVGNEKLKEYYLDVSCRTRLFRIRAHPPDGAMTPEIGELLQKGIHRRLEVVKALRSRDPEAVAAVMRDNVEKSFLNNEKMFFRHQASNSVHSGRVA